MVKFSYHNSKMWELAKYLGLKKTEVVAFDLPAGYTCPKANICLTYADKNDGKIKRVGRVQCYASKAESQHPNVRLFRWNNFTELKHSDNMVELLNNSIPEKAKIIRIHSSGDFFSFDYFMAWRELAILHPEKVFFGYTKILDYCKIDLPDNFTLQYSFGSKDDGLLTSDIPTCYVAEYDNQYPEYKVVCSEKSLGYEDYLAIRNHESFVIGMH